MRVNLKRYFEFDRKIFLKNKKLIKFKRGSFVKIFKIKVFFIKGYFKIVIMEYFKIYVIDRRLLKDRYYLKDFKGDKLLGVFYEDYLVYFILFEDENY